MELFGARSEIRDPGPDFDLFPHRRPPTHSRSSFRYGVVGRALEGDDRKTKNNGSRLEGIPGRRGDETLDPAHVHTGTTIKISESIIS